MWGEEIMFAQDKKDQTFKMCQKESLSELGAPRVVPA